MGSRMRRKLRLPFTLELAHAARELAVAPEVLAALIAAGLIWTVHIGDRELIPASEVHRLASIRKELALEPRVPRRGSARARRR